MRLYFHRNEPIGRCYTSTATLLYICLYPTHDGLTLTKAGNPITTYFHIHWYSLSLNNLNRLTSRLLTRWLLAGKGHLGPSALVVGSFDLREERWEIATPHPSPIA